jgi:DNA-binding MarR family transcriptional regulator
MLPGVDADRTVDALESLAVGAVAITTLALTQAGVELTFAQWRVLMVLADAPDGATVGEIAAKVGSATSPASRLIARMRDREMVVTHKDDLDHRATRVHLSEHGWAVRDRVLTRRRDLLTAALARHEPVSPEVHRRLGELAHALRTAV